MKPLIRFSLLFPIAIAFFYLVATQVSCNKNNSNSGSNCVSCLNGGTCINDSCTCAPGYEGSGCSIMSRSKFLGSWKVVEKGSMTDTAKYTVSIDTVANQVPNVYIGNFYNYFSAPVLGYVWGDTLYIPIQQMEGKMILGQGYISSNTIAGTNGEIILNYEIVDTATQKTNDFGYISSDLSAPSIWTK